MIAMITCTTDITTHAHRKFCSLNCMMNVRVVTCKGAVVQGSQPVVRSQQEVETGGHLALFSTKPHTPAEEEDEAQVAESRKRAFEPQVFCIPTGQRPSVADHDLSDEWTKTSPAFRAYFKGSAAHKKVRVQFLRRRLPDVACLWLHLWYGMYRLITLTRYFRQIFFPQMLFTSQIKHMEIHTPTAFYKRSMNITSHPTMSVVQIMEKAVVWKPPQGAKRNSSDKSADTDAVIPPRKRSRMSELVRPPTATAPPCT